MDRGRVRVILEMERDGFPIRGSLATAAGVMRGFHGWLELADALESARAGDDVSDAPAGDRRAAEPPAVARIR